MEMEKCIKEMEGKILLLDNKKFVLSISLIGIYYVWFLGFLAYQILETTGAH